MCRSEDGGGIEHNSFADVTLGEKRERESKKGKSNGFLDCRIAQALQKRTLSIQGTEEAKDFHHSEEALSSRPLLFFTLASAEIRVIIIMSSQAYITQSTHSKIWKAK